MKNKIYVRVISLIVCVCVLFTATASALQGVSLRKDTNSNYLKYITGFSDYTFRPDDPVTRAQAAQMLSFVLEIENVDSAKVFADVPGSFWGYSAISDLSSIGIIGGYQDGTFRPNRNMTRAEFSVILARALDVSGGRATFSDTVNHWAVKEISALADAKIIGGYPDKTFRPNATLTRAEAVSIINRAVGISGITKDELVFTDVTEEHWAYSDILAAASTTALVLNKPRGEISFDEIDYIDLNSDELSDEFDALLNEFASASTERQVEIFLEIDAIESDVALAVAMSTIRIEQDSTSERDINNVNQAYACENLVKKAKERRYDLLSAVRDSEVFSKGIGMDISEIPAPSASAPDELIELYTEQQKYCNDFNTFMYSAAIIYNNRVYSLSQAEYSGISELRTLALNYYLEHEKEYGEIFDNLVDVRTRIANYYGYDTYTDVGYMISGKYNYTSEDASIVHSEVKEFIAPLYYKISLASQGVQNGYEINTDTYNAVQEDAIEKISDYLRELSPQTREAFDYMEKYDMLDTEMRANKTTGAFTTYISEYETPFLFMNENSSVEDIETLAHEFGHAFHAFRIGESGISCSYDIAEVASYGMEMLTTHNYEEFFGEDAQDVMLTGFYYKMNIMLATCLLDEFQYKVYANPDMTYKERNNLYASLFKEYFIGYNPNHEALEKGIVWSNPGHIFESPYYAIDYTLALLVAFQLWEVGETEGFDRQFETYMEIIESPFIEYSIETVALYAGLDSPFTDGILQGVAEKMDTLFKRHNN